MTEELKQAAQQALMECPFCGSEPHDAQHIEYGRWAVTCRCGTKGASANTGPNATDAAKIKAYSDARTAWNTRALAQRPTAQTEREAYATARAFALATVAAEEFVRCNGLPIGEADEFLMTGPDLTDEHATACINHLKWVGECVAFDCDDGVLVRLGDFTLGSLA